MFFGAGKFDRQIWCDEPIATEGVGGEELIDFAPAFVAFARIEPLTGREALLANQTLANLDTRITVRWSARNLRITPKWRLRYRDTIYNIAEQPRDIEMAHRELEIMCKSGTNLG